MKRAVALLSIAWLAALALLMLAGEAGLRLNASASVPRGVYWLSSQAPVRGAYVALCPPPAPIFELAWRRGYVGHGRCPGGHAELIKVLAAEAGDHVRIDATGVRVGTRTWPSAGRRLPQLPPTEITLASDSVLVMSRDCALGFDGRYFGPLPSAAVVGTAVPLFTW